MIKDTSSKRIDAIAEEAADWLVTLNSADSQAKAAFAAWLKTSPEHVNEFLAIAVLWDALPELSSQPSVAQLIARATTECNVVTLSREEPVLQPADTASGKRRWLGFAAAATLAAVLIGGALTLVPLAGDPNLYTTAIGEQRSLSLPDGSLVTLNTQSTLRVAYSEAYRDIYLMNGEALFEVAKNPDRPFRVMADRAVIEAVGTQFNVINTAKDVTVTVVEGIVDVITAAARNQSGVPPPATQQAVRLTVGQQARVATQSGEVAVVDAAIDNAIAWQERRLVFESLSLKDVIDEFNRYNDPPLLIEDATLRQLPISGVFQANDRESFVQFLTQMQLAEGTKRGDGTIVLRAMADE